MIKILSRILCVMMVISMLPMSVLALNLPELDVLEDVVGAVETVEAENSEADKESSAETEEPAPTEDSVETETPKETEEPEMTGASVDAEENLPFAEEGQESKTLLGASLTYPIYIESLEQTDSARYTGNQGDSFIGVIGTRNGTTGVSGNTYEHGLELWVARWNFKLESSWVWAEYDVSEYTQTGCSLTGFIDVASNCANKTTYNTQVNILGDGSVLYSVILTSDTTYPLPFSVDLTGVTTLRIDVEDNESAKAGTSFLIGDLKITDEVIFNGLRYPGDYDFDRDRYSFRNHDCACVVPLEVYQSVYGEEKGLLLYNKFELDDNGKGEKHGVCYGLAVTTASLLLDIPDVSSFIKLTGPCNYIRDINKGTLCFEFDGVSAKTFINYGYVTQFAVEANRTWVYCDCELLYNAVYDYVCNNGAPVSIGMRRQRRNPDNNFEALWGHEVLAVGLIGNDTILIDDSNHDDIQQLVLERDTEGNFTNSWKYSGLDDAYANGSPTEADIEYTFLSFDKATLLPYSVLAGCATLTSGVEAAEENEDSTVICDVNELDVEYNLISVYADTTISADDYYLQQIGIPHSGTTNSDSAKTLYWFNNKASIAVENLSGIDSPIQVAGNDMIIGVAASRDASSKLTLDEASNNTNATIYADDGTECEVTVFTFGNDNEEVLLTIDGTAFGGEMSTRKDKNMVVLDGISNGTISLANGEELVIQEVVENINGDVEIEYDPTGDTNKIVIIYDGSSVLGDVTGNGIFDVQDLVCLMKYIAGCNVTINKNAIDPTGNGTTDVLDVVRLVRYLA